MHTCCFTCWARVANIASWPLCLKLESSVPVMLHILTAVGQVPHHLQLNVFLVKHTIELHVYWVHWKIGLTSSAVRVIHTILLLIVIIVEFRIHIFRSSFKIKSDIKSAHQFQGIAWITLISFAPFLLFLTSSHVLIVSSFNDKLYDLTLQ